MMKDDFLNNLTDALSGLPNEEIRKTTEYYCEIIDDAVEDGEDEATVIARLGSINEIAEKIINETPISKFVKEDVKNYHMSAAAIILIIISSPVWFPVLIALCTIAFTLYITIWTLVAVLFIVFAALALGAVSMLITSPFLLPVRPIKAMAAFGLALVCAGMAVFMFYLSVLCAKMTIKFTLFIIRGIKNIFIKRRNDAK